ncbi:MAG: hypothetical protein AVDCRST_MAG36-753, partial [uncultured Nocardioidaceae bacterium]
DRAARGAVRRHRRRPAVALQQLPLQPGLHLLPHRVGAEGGPARARPRDHAGARPRGGGRRVHRHRGDRRRALPRPRHAPAAARAVAGPPGARAHQRDAVLPGAAGAHGVPARRRR